MATVTFAISSPSEGTAWSFSLNNITNTNNLISNQSQYASVTGNYNGQSFTMVNNSESCKFYSPHYATWRFNDAVSNLQNGQYPTQGFSFDIWGGSPRPGTAGNLLGKFNSNWGSGVEGSYDLDTNKWSMIYDYTNQYPLALSRGGILTITITS
jgi:hypothetical protein